MQALSAIAAAAFALFLAGCTAVEQRPSAEAKAALAPTGKLRVGVYLGNPLSVIRDATTQETRGAGLDLGRELARRLQVPFEPVIYPAIGALLDGAKTDQWDVALFQVSPARAEVFHFSPPLIEIELGYLVPKDSPISSPANVDAAGVRIAVAEKGQADAILSRQLKQATLVRVAGLAAAAEALKAGKVDAIGNVKPSLFELAKQLPGWRVLDGRFATEHLAIAVPRGREAAMPYVREFAEAAKSQGLVKAAMDKAGAQGAVVAAVGGGS